MKDFPDPRFPFICRYGLMGRRKSRVRGAAPRFGRSIGLDLEDNISNPKATADSKGFGPNPQLILASRGREEAGSHDWGGEGFQLFWPCGPYLFIYVYIHIHIYIRKHVHICIYMCICMCVCNIISRHLTLHGMCIHTHT